MTQSKTPIPDKIFFKIGEVCDLLGVQAHVLRYWETEFPMLSPKKNKSGQRTYRRKDVEIAVRIKDLLYDDQFTIAGAIKRLQRELKTGEILEPQFDEQVLNDPLEATVDTETLLRSVQREELNLGEDQKEALKKLVSQLLEVREILNRNSARNNERELTNSRQI